MQEIIQILDFIKAINDLKFELRYGVDNTIPKRDSVAAHSWRMSIITFLLAEKLDIGLNINKCMKIALIHDLPEVMVGDTPFSKVVHNPDEEISKLNREKKGMKTLCSKLPNDLNIEIYNLWEEYALGKTIEAKFVKIMDKIEAAYQSIYIGVDMLKNKDATVMHSNRGYGWFKELDPIIQLVRSELKKEYDEKNITWKAEYNVE